MTPLLTNSYFEFRTSTIFLGIKMVLAPESIMELWSNLSPTIRVKNKGLGSGLHSFMLIEDSRPSLVSTSGVRYWFPDSGPFLLVCDSFSIGSVESFSVLPSSSHKWSFYSRMVRISHRDTFMGAFFNCSTMSRIVGIGNLWVHILVRYETFSSLGSRNHNWLFRWFLYTFFWLLYHRNSCKLVLGAEIIVGLYLLPRCRGCGSIICKNNPLLFHL